MTPPNVAVIGLGCIGGSLVKALAGSDARVHGWSASLQDSAMARALGNDVPESLDDTLADAELIVIAVPVQAIARVSASAIRAVPASATILHCGGVQSPGALRMDERSHARVLGTHPLAGSHESGFGAARADLFEGCAVSIESRRSAEQERWASWLWKRVGAARLEYRAAEAHDALVAWISHLPQLTSTALAAALADEHIDPASAGPGARDTTRLAASEFDQWSAIVQAQPATLDAALARVEHKIAAIRDSLARDDLHQLRAIWDSARDWRRAAEPIP